MSYTKVLSVLFSLLVLFSPVSTFAAYHFSNFKASPPIHILGSKSLLPKGVITPSIIKKIYNLPSSGGHGTIAIIGAYDDKTIESDLAVFSKQFNLPECSTANGCFEKHLISSGTKSNNGWQMETSLDIEWAHAIAPQAKILLVSAQTPSGANLIKAIDYARNQSGVVAISMSFGGPEFSGETTAKENHFTSALTINSYVANNQAKFVFSGYCSHDEIIKLRDSFEHHILNIITTALKAPEKLRINAI